MVDSQPLGIFTVFSEVVILMKNGLDNLLICSFCVCCEVFSRFILETSKESRSIYFLSPVFLVYSVFARHLFISYKVEILLKI